MSETNTNPAQDSNLVVTLTVGQLKGLIREQVEMGTNSGTGEERLLDVDEASELLGMSRCWLYRHASKLPFTRRLGRKNLRFSYQGIQKYLATRKMC